MRCWRLYVWCVYVCIYIYIYTHIELYHCVRATAKFHATNPLFLCGSHLSALGVWDRWWQFVWRASSIWVSVHLSNSLFSGPVWIRPSDFAMLLFRGPHSHDVQMPHLFQAFAAYGLERRDDFPWDSTKNVGEPYYTHLRQYHNPMVYIICTCNNILYIFLVWRVQEPPVRVYPPQRGVEMLITDSSVTGNTERILGIKLLGITCYSQPTIVSQRGDNKWMQHDATSFNCRALWSMLLVSIELTVR